MKLLLTSSGIANASINDALVELLGKPVSASNALFIPTGMHPFREGGANVMRAMRGESNNVLCGLGWKSLGLLELTALASVERGSWVGALEDADALIVWGGNVMYLQYWMQQSGVAEILPTLDLVYVGVSAGSIVMTSYNCDAEWNRQSLPSGSAVVRDDDRALGLVNFTMWVHVDNPDPMFEDHAMAHVESWAKRVPAPTYALDDQTALRVVNGTVDVVSQGRWQLFNSR